LFIIQEFLKIPIFKYPILLKIIKLKLQLSKSMTPTLTNQKILVTRPIRQAHKLCQLISKAGGQPIHFPVIEIIEIQDKSELSSQCASLNSGDIAIFISANAVENTLPFLLKYPVSKTLQLFAVGKKTATILSKKRLSVVCAPSPFNSETLLTLPALQQSAIQGKKVVIFKGEGGRELLADSLRQRGASVSTVAVYQRIQPSEPINITQVPDIITITSVQSLHHLFSMLSEKSWLKNTPLAVLGERIAKQACQFTQAPVFIAPFASDEGLLNAILEWHKNSLKN